MRPLYETNADLDREGGIAAYLEGKWKCNFIKLPIRYHLDFVLTRNDSVAAYAEVKTRNYSMDAIDSMGGYLMSIGKWEAAKSLSEASKVPFILIVKTLDGLYRSRIDNFHPDGLLVRGRTDRNDWQDIEPCVCLHVNRFKRVN